MAQRAIVRVGGKSIVAGHTDTWKELVATFVASQDVKESSRALYARTLSQYFLWIEKENKVVAQLDREDILEYKDSLLSSGLSNLTVSSYLVVVRKFYEWAEAKKLYPNIARGVKTPKRLQQFKKQHLTDAKSAELVNLEGLSLRDRAIINLILRTGLRTIEVVRANIEDITFKGERRVLKVWGKGRDTREDFVILTDKAYQPIREYLDSNRKFAKGGEPLFSSESHQNSGKRLTTRTISGICKEGLKAVGLDGKEFTAHSLRHTTACAILKHGGTIADAQAVLRHTSPVTTQIYLESIKEEQRLQNASEALIDNAF